MDEVTVPDALLMVLAIAEEVSYSSIRLAPGLGQDDGLTSCLDVRIARMLLLTGEKPRTAPTREVPFSLQASTIQVVHYACSRALLHQDETVFHADRPKDKHATSSPSFVQLQNLS
jgi:hypothetical protein